LPELPQQDEERLQRAARLLQQKLVLRQWLMDHGLHNYYQKYEEIVGRTRKTNADHRDIV
jgi:hypothetical protein